MNWPTPKNVSDIRYFMGSTCYCLKFLKGFSKISYSIIALKNKGIKFDWTFKCETRFQKLKEMLTSAPVLKIMNLDENFVVCTYACQQGICGGLTQNGNVICYESRNLK